MFEKTKKFVKEHKTEIIAGSIVVAGGILVGCKLNKMNNEMKLLKNTDNALDKVNLEKVLDDIQKKLHKRVQRIRR